MHLKHTKMASSRRTWSEIALCGEMRGVCAGVFQQPARTAAYGYLFNWLGQRAKTWADRYKSVISQYASSNPLEVALMTDMLRTIPDYVIGNESTWAAVLIGFESYSKEQAISSVGIAIAEFEGNTIGMRTFNPSSWVDFFTTSSDVRDAVNLPNLYREAYSIVRNGPQIFNQTWYEGIWGRPPHPWQSYYPGWRP